MIRFYKLFILLSFLVFGYGCQTKKALPVTVKNFGAEKITLRGFSNLYKVDNGLYRAEQPTKQEMLLLDSIGFKTIINLRLIKNDNHEAVKTDLKLVHVHINTWTISYKDVVKGMKALMTAQKPVLVHCKHGSDRTGCIIAAYRIAIQNWPKEKAIQELREGGFGYHEKYFYNIVKLLNTIDVEKLKKDIEN